MNLVSHPRHYPPRWGLLGLAIVGLAMGVSYLPLEISDVAAVPRGLKLLTLFVPIWIYALAWLVSGILVGVAAIRNRPGWAGVGAIAFMSSLFGSFYLIGWAVDQFAYDNANRTYVVGIILIGFALYISGNVPPDPPSESGIPSATVEKADQ